MMGQQKGPFQNFGKPQQQSRREKIVWVILSAVLTILLALLADYDDAAVTQDWLLVKKCTGDMDRDQCQESRSFALWSWYVGFEQPVRRRDQLPDD